MTINIERYVISQSNEDMSARGVADDLIGWGFLEEAEAKRVANFGAMLAPHGKVFKVQLYVTEVTK